MDFGCVMTGGGSRGAYQAGVMKLVGEILPNKKSPFKIFAGASAGALNTSYLATQVSDFKEGTARLAALWESLRAEDVYRTNITSVVQGASQVMRDLTLGGILGGGRARSLLDASPLYKLIENHLPLDRLATHIQKGDLKALAITATDYGTGKSFTFVQGALGHPLWKRSRKLSLSVQMKPEHICASAAIPIVFSPVLLRTDFGLSYFGDGCLRLTAPLSPAIRLGAKKIFAVGVRKQRAPDDGFESSLRWIQDEESLATKPQIPSFARIFGVILNAIFLDHLDSDVEHLQRVNELVATTDSAHDMSEPMDTIQCFDVSPSVDLAEVAQHHAKKLPKLVRYLIRGLGSSRLESADLISYLLFDPVYTKELVHLGYEDAKRFKSDLKDYLFSD